MTEPTKNGADKAAAQAPAAPEPTNAELLARIEAMEKRLAQVESSTAFIGGHRPPAAA